MGNTLRILPFGKNVAMEGPSRDFFFGGDLRQLPQKDCLQTPTRCVALFGSHRVERLKRLMVA